MNRRINGGPGSRRDQGVEREARRTGRTIDEVANDTLRIALARGRGAETAPFKVDAVDIGLRPGIAVDNIHGFLESIEGNRQR